MAMRTAFSLATAVALIGSLLLLTSGAAPDEEEALVADDACADGSEQCELSLRQLRGERKATAESFLPTGDDDESKEQWDEAVYGPFCCQNGQGRGYTDPEDIGMSCYPTAKAELDGYCDAKSTCLGDCNGTWVEGFCGFAMKGKEGSDICKTALAGPKSLRADKDSECDTEATCGVCNGTWCHYKKAPRD
mmetsp:Transcript_103118/g.274155  ORF Transcript_103118/g.274155 Transcript_103118/m.274155 type:complete len:191 (-) Transcript_103118:162-734(-)